jgi:hypothetical protein
MAVLRGGIQFPAVGYQSPGNPFASETGTDNHPDYPGTYPFLFWNAAGKLCKIYAAWADTTIEIAWQEETGK